jgi:hypothetical protein
VDNIYHYFQRACLRAPGPARGTPGPAVHDAEGNCATFWIEASGGRIASIQFKCTTCFTLVALCQHLAEASGALTLEEAGAITAEDLLRFHPEIPQERRDRASLAVEAFRAALTARSQIEGVSV